MEICAIVLNYFGAADTLECLGSLLQDSVLRQIVVVENSASDEERARIKSGVGEKEWFRILCPERNLGFAGGVNHALSILGVDAYDAFLLINNDTIVPTGTVRLLEERLIEGGFGFVAPSIYQYPEISSVWSRGSQYNRYAGLVTNHRLSVLPGNLYYLTGCCLLIRSGVLKKIGLFDESFFMYGEDVEFCYRAARHGLKYGVVPEAKIFHKGSRSSQNNSLFYEYHLNRAHLLLCERLARTSAEARLCGLSKMAVISLRAFWRVFRSGNLNSLRGFRKSVAEFLRAKKGMGRSRCC